MGAPSPNPQAYGVSGAASGFGANPGYGRQAPTIGGQTDPQSQALLQAMKSLGQQPQGNMTGLASNLLADALLQYSLKQRQQQALAGPQGALQAQDAAKQALLNDSGPSMLPSDPAAMAQYGDLL